MDDVCLSIRIVNRDISTTGSSIIGSSSRSSRSSSSGSNCSSSSSSNGDTC